jgi:hypothetical protein
LPIAASAQGVEDRPTRTITDADIEADDNVTFYADSVYVLDGAVFVEAGAELHIQSGTVIKAQDGQDLDASALIITRGAQIFAEGTATDPIIFTSIQDNISSADALTYEDRGLWGGVIILGDASTNNQPPPGDLEEIEGVNELLADGDTRDQFGGTDDDDDSGVFRYVSIRHTGINIGESAGNEIQGLTLGGVGNGTTIEYVESYSSADDGFEFFGGAVNTKYLVSAFNGDDAFDYDQGFRGNHQFWFAIQGTDEAGALAEQDGAGGTEIFEPFAIPVVYNATYIGAGVDATPAGDRAEALMFRDNAGGKYYNSIFTEYNSAEGGFALTIENLDTSTGSTTRDSQQRFEEGDLVLSNNIWGEFGNGSTFAEIVTDDDGNRAAIVAALNDWDNLATDPMLAGITRSTTPSGALDPRPLPGSPALSSDLAAYPDGSFFTEVDFIGAFGEDLWIEGWTALDVLGYVGRISNIAIEKNPTDEIPQRVSLGQNYPNPFNPTTKIEFALDRTQGIRLAIYDVLGRQVRVLVDGLQQAGEYSVSFDGSGLASGTYVYMLNTENDTAVRKMSLIK